MAKNTGKGYRIGSVNARTQTFDSTTGKWIKRDAGTGQFLDVKTDGKPHKGVARETDDRRS